MLLEPPPLDMATKSGVLSDGAMALHDTFEKASSSESLPDGQRLSHSGRTRRGSESDAL